MDSEISGCFKEHCIMRKEISVKCCYSSCRTVYRNNNVSCESSCDAV